jgi:RHS repeat-associated protein
MVRRTAVLLCLLLCAPAAVWGGQYIVVLKPGAGLDLAHLGAQEEHRWRNRVQVRIDDAAVAALRAHPDIAYVQQLLAPGEVAAFTEEKPVVANGSTAASWSSGAILYDGANNTIRIEDDAYAVDSLSRVVRAEVTSRDITTTEHYRYDAFGNLHHRTMTNASGSSEWPAPVQWSTNRLDGLTYDGVGNVLRDDGAAQDYSWDAMRMMRKLSANGSNQTYIYSATDERVAVKSGEVWKWTFRDRDGRVLRAMESSDGGPSLWVEDFAYREQTLIGAERPVAQGGRRHLHMDHLSTVRLITDHSGQAISQHDFLPFGIELTSMRQEQARGYDRENPLRFMSHEREFLGGTATENANTIDYMHARYYRSQWARFLSCDPAGDITRGAIAPQRWNRYAYTLNNPLKFTDPDGRREALVYGQKMNVEPGFAVILRDKETKRVSHVVVVADFKYTAGNKLPEALIYENAPKENHKGEHYITDKNSHKPTPQNSNDPNLVWSTSKNEVASIESNYYDISGKGDFVNFRPDQVQAAVDTIGVVTYSETQSGMPNQGTNGLTCDCAGYADLILQELNGTLDPTNFFGTPWGKLEWEEEAESWWDSFTKWFGGKGNH